jgi:hypothetical protein
MTCQECRDQMLEVARRRSAPFVERAVVAHAAGCGECGRGLERDRAISAQLRALASATAAGVPSAGLEARLMAAFETERGVPSATGRRRQAWLAAAAGLVLSVAASAWWLSGTRQPQAAVSQTARAADVSNAAPAAVPTPPAVPAVQVAPPAGRPRPAPARPSAGPRPPRRPPAPEPVQATGFVPLPAAAGLPDFESGEIVRIGISVTSLPNYGLEIPSGADAAILADFLVGQDGQARAIRLVTADAQSPRPR